MTDGEAQHTAVMKKAKEDAAALEKTRLANLKLTNPCLFDTELKFAITKLLHTNLYKKNNPYCNLFESENIKSWVEFLDMYQANPLSVYTDEFPYTDKDRNMVTGPNRFPRTTKLIDSQASLLLMLYFYATEWIKGTPPRHSLPGDLVELANHPSKWDKQDVY